MASVSPARSAPLRAEDLYLLDSLLTTSLVGDEALLDDLLAVDLPAQGGAPRPAALRSTAEQRRIALRPFRLRTWVDTALHRLEQGLVIAAVIAFSFWFFDGYVRDWIHEWQSTRSAEAHAAQPTPTLALSLPDTAPPAVAAHLPALPFTTPNMSAGAAGADFLAPQRIPSRPQQDDPRPRRLLIPSIGVDTPVSEVFIVNEAWQVADYAAGYHHGTALPGAVGNMVMAGHAGLRGAVFRDLGNLQPGDEAIVETAGWQYRYKVRELREVWPTQVEVMDPTPTAVLTLITCTNWDTQRLIVVADLIDARPLS